MATCMWNSMTSNGKGEWLKNRGNLIDRKEWKKSDF